MPDLQPVVVTVEDAKNPTLLVRVLRIISDNISAVNTRLSAAIDQIKQITSKVSISAIQTALQSSGSNPINVTSLRGVLADPQPAGIIRYPAIPTGLLLQSIRDTQTILVQNGSTYDLYTVVGGSPNTLIKLIAGTAGGTTPDLSQMVTINTVQTITANKTFSGALYTYNNAVGVTGALTTTAQITANGGIATSSFSPITGGINITDGNLQIKGQQIIYFIVELINSAGTIQHRIFANAQSSALGSYIGQVSGASATLNNTPQVNSGTGFTTGVGVDASATQRLVFNTSSQTEADVIYAPTITQNNTTTPLCVEPRLDNINVNGVTRQYLCLVVRNSTTGTSYPITAANIPSGGFFHILVIGYVL